MFVDPLKPFTADIPADTIRNLWPDFQIHFLPPVEFEVTDAMNEGSEGMMRLIRAKIKSWSGLRASTEAAAYLNTKHASLFRRVINAGDEIPYHQDLLSNLHSVCLSTIWRKIAGFLPLKENGTETTQDVQEATAKN